MNIYKLTYQNKEHAIEDLEIKGILILTEEGQIYGNGVQAVVEIGLIVLDVVDEQPIYADGYHYDVMSLETYDFSANLVEPNNPMHQFAGY